MAVAVVVVTGACAVMVATFVTVCSGIERKELQHLVAEALMRGSLRILRISETG